MKNYCSMVVKIISAFLIILIFNQKTFSAPSWQWAKTGGGTSEERSYNTAIDNSGNVYSVGSFKTSSIIFGTYTLTNTGQEDIFLVKYDPAGNVLWAKSFGGTDIETGYSVHCDNTDNVYITGFFTGTSITFGAYTLINAGMGDIFLAKLDQSGSVLWANSYGGSGDDFGNNLTSDVNGNIYLVGNFNSASIIFGSDTLLAVGTAKAFVAKFDQNGNEIWADGSRGPSYDAGKCVATDINGNIYLAGEYYDFQVWFETDTLLNNGEDDIFIVKYDSNGNEIWVKSIGGFNADKITGLVAADNGDLFISGHFFSPFIQFDSVTLNNADFPAWDMYIAKLDLQSNVVWAKSAAGNTDEDVIADMEKAPNGNLLVTGWFGASITLGSTTLTSNGSFDVFVAEVDTAGSFLWAVSAGGTDQDFTYSLSVDASGEIIIGGFFQSPSLPFGGTILTDNNPGWDMFVSKLASPNAVKEINNSRLDLFPNPVSNQLSISITESGNYNLQIFNSSGQIILDKTGYGKRVFLVDCRNYSEGIYYVLINTRDETQSSKIVVTHEYE